MNIQQEFTSESHLISRNRNGNIDTVLVGEEVVIETAVGKLVPRYTLDDGDGRKKEAPVKFFKTGELKSLPLEKITEIQTTVGSIKSELLIFYKSGALHRVFPLNGQVTGFWTEEDEYEMAKTIEFSTSIGVIKVKPIYIQFYETGELESILFWPNEQVKIATESGEIIIHKGISFYKNGNIKGYEPTKETLVESPIGKIKVFDPDPNGMQAENHSINFYDDGTIKSVITSSNQVTVLNDGVKLKVFSPKIVTSYCNENAFFVSPLKILFEESALHFNNINESIESIPRNLQYHITDFVPIKPISNVGC